MKQCTKCSREISHRGRFCNSCVTNKRKTKVKHMVVDYLGGKCADCGYSKSITALECHHLDPSQKEFTISGSHCRAWKSIQAEIDKCILLCSNCHRETEYGIIPPLAPLA